MFEHDARFVQSFGARHGHVFLAEHVQQAGAHHAGDDGGFGQRQRQRGQKEIGEVVAVRDAGEPAQVHRKDHDQQQPQPEGRHRHAADRDAHDRRVEPGAVVQRCGQSHRKAEHQCNRQRRHRQRHRAGQLFEDRLGNGHVIADRLAEIAAQGAAEIAPVLHGDRVVQPQLDAQLHHALGRDLLASQDRSHGIARHEMDDRKDQHRDAEEHKDRGQKTAG